MLDLTLELYPTAQSHLQLLLLAHALSYKTIKQYTLQGLTTLVGQN